MKTGHGQEYFYKPEKVQRSIFTQGEGFFASSFTAIPSGLALSLDCSPCGHNMAATVPGITSKLTSQEREGSCLFFVFPSKSEGNFSRLISQNFAMCLYKPITNKRTGTTAHGSDHARDMMRVPETHGFRRRVDTY